MAAVDLSQCCSYGREIASADPAGESCDRTDALLKSAKFPEAERYDPLAARRPGVISVALEPDQLNDGSQSGQLVRDQVLKLVGT
ncbi:hypothetical protein ABIA00_007687 [Bradyrhizobium ottawaense]|jgi:hypothetical protein